MVSRRLRILIFAVLPLVSACSDDPTGPTHPDLRGSYAATWSYRFDAGAFGGYGAICTGGLTVSEQSDGEFAGSFTTHASSEDCEASSGTFEGEVRPDGSLNFILDAQGTDEELGALTGCSVVSSDNQLNGTFQNNVISADTNAILDCPTEFGILRVALELELVASKT